MNKKIITISREFGSGGHYIGEQTAKRCGIAYYDKAIIEKIAERTGFSQKYIKEKSEYASGKSIFSYAFIGRDLMGASISDKIFEEQSRIIRELAEKESCVIIGRCADYILRDVPGCLHIFIRGDRETKCRRIESLYHKSRKEAMQMMKDMDKKRGINYKYYTEQNWGSAENYTVTLNSSVLGIEQCVDIIANLKSV